MRGSTGRRLSRLAVAALTTAGLATAGLATGLAMGSAAMAAPAAPTRAAVQAVGPDSTWDDGYPAPGSTWDDGHPAPFDSTWDDGIAPDSADPVANLLNGISCASLKSCVATGVNLDATVPLAESWNGSSWKITGAKLPKGATGGQLGGVSCVSAKDCVSAGYYSAGSGQHPLAETWNGSTWTTAAPPGKAGVNTGLSKISCLNGKYCFAVGTYTAGAAVTEPLADLWNGKAWVGTPIKLPAKAPDSSFNSFDGVSCVSAKDCVAVGGVSSETAAALLIEAWNGKAWSPMQPAALPKGSANETFEGVSCLSAKSCVAVGLASAGSGIFSFSEIWNGSAWSYAKMTWPKGTVNPEVWGVGCRSAAYCVAAGDVGQNLNVEGRTGHAAISVWNGKVWSPVKVSTAGKGKHSLFDSVSCQKSFCGVAGQYGPEESTNGIGLTAFATGTSWKVVAAK
jgi:hypothetical protein